MRRRTWKRAREQLETEDDQPGGAAPPMREPHRRELARLIREGAASQDVHDAGTGGGYASDHGAADERFVARELDRVALHLRALAPLLERGVGRARRVLDFGCGTGATTLAIALARLGVEEVVGVDASARALAAAEVRAAAYGLGPPRVRFVHVPPGAPLPGGAFDLVVAVSVLEFITRDDDRRGALAALRDRVRAGGHLFVATPKVGLRELHTGRLLGDLRREPGLPRASSRRALAAWLDGWERVPLADGLAARARLRLSRWHKLLVRRPSELAYATSPSSSR